jgi:uncharacterized membrane protein (UPF0136 family)
MPPAVAGINGEFLAVAAIGAGAVVALLLPFIAGRTARSRQVVVWMGLFALAVMTAMTWLALTESAP